MTKTLKSFRLDEGTTNLLQLLSRKLNRSQTEIIELAIRSLANQKCTPDEIFKEYFEKIK